MTDVALQLKDVILRLQGDIQAAANAIESSQREPSSAEPGTTMFLANNVLVDLKAAASLEADPAGPRLMIAPVGLALRPESGAVSSVQVNFAPVPGITATVTLLDLRGHPLPWALGTLRGQGLLVGTVTEQFIGGSIAPGTVFSQEPMPGTTVGAGTYVNLVIAATGTVAVPNLVGMGLVAALTTLRSNGLHDGSITQVAPPPSHPTPGTVTAQSPAAGTVVTRGTSVALTIVRLLDLEPG
jgi:hypothetical protein